MQPISIGDIGVFMETVFNAFGAPLFMAFTLMITLAVMVGIKSLMVDGMR